MTATVREWDNPGTIRKLVLDALARGKTSDHRHWEVDYAKFCEDPVKLYFEGPTKVTYSRKYAGRIRKSVSAWVPCRKCYTCRKISQFNWTSRAMVETAAAGRTWFVTLTYRPDEIQRILVGTAHRLDSRGTPFDALPERTRFGHMTTYAAPDVTRWLKRIRHHTKMRKAFRYMLVCEKHCGHGRHHGYPHFHLLVHEPTIFRTLTERLLRREWRERHGICQAKLVRPGS